ncbi:MAG TPA: hypothetical protein VKT77_11440 [Chthonomonadaceae bacterium]|nr:hypothetical protein [Chthonomonadaceae bacterium]
MKPLIGLFAILAAAAVLPVQPASAGPTHHRIRVMRHRIHRLRHRVRVMHRRIHHAVVHHAIHHM